MFLKLNFSLVGRSHFCIGCKQETLLNPSVASFFLFYAIAKKQGKELEFSKDNWKRICSLLLVTGVSLW